MQVWLEKYGWYGSRVLQVVEARLSEQSWSWMLVRQIAGELTVARFELRNNWEEISPLVEAYPGVPVVLAVCPPAPVEKLVPATAANPLAEALGVQVKERNAFAYQSIPAEKEKQLISLIRQEELRKIYDQLGSVQERVIGVNISQAPLGYLISSLGEPKGLVYRLAYRWSSRWVHYAWLDGIIAIPNAPSEELSDKQIATSLGIPTEALFAYASALQQLVMGGDSLTGWEITENAYKKWIGQHRLLRGLGMALPFIWGVLLLISLLGAGLQFRSQSLSKQLQADQQSLSHIRSQQGLIRQQSEFIRQTARKSLRPSKISWYLDQLASLCPRELSLREIWVFPTEEDWKTLRRNEGDPLPDILLVGQAKEAQAINQLAQSISNHAQLGSPVIRESTFDFQQKYHQFVMSIQLPTIDDQP